MFIIESTNPKGWRWLSGVFKDRSAAEQQIHCIAETERGFHRIVESPLTHFPIFIVERRGFEYVDLKDVLRELSSTGFKGDDDYVHFNVYAVKAEFVPSEPGIDEMGYLLHWHITDDALREPRAAVFKAELAEISSDA